MAVRAGSTWHPRGSGARGRLIGFALVQAFVDDILVNGRMGKLAGYFDGDNYIQHNPQIADKLSGLGAALQAMAKAGSVTTPKRV